MTTTPDLSNVEQMPQPDIRGWLALNNLPPEIQRQEDSTAMVDKDRYRLLSPRGHIRDATPAERMLLAHLGYVVPEQLSTKVSWPSRSVRRRTWPQLEGVTP